MSDQPTYRFGDYHVRLGLDAARVQSETARAFDLLYQLVKLKKVEHLLPSSNTPIAWAARMFGQSETSQEKQIKELSQTFTQMLTARPCYVDLDAARNDNDYRLLHVAAECGLVDSVAALLEAGAPINSSADAGTALMLAIHARQQPVVDLLLRAGADVQKGSGRGLRVNQITYCNHALHEAAITNQPEVIAQLVAHQADLRVYDMTGRTALSAIILSGFREAAQMLLDLGSNPNQRDALRDDVPLNVAVLIGSDSMLSLLLEYGADMHACATYDKETGCYHLIQRDNATDSHIKNAIIQKRWEAAWTRWEAIEKKIDEDSFDSASISAKDVVLCANIGKEGQLLEAVLQHSNHTQLSALLTAAPVWIQETFTAQHPGVINRLNTAAVDLSWSHKVTAAASARPPSGKALS